MDPGTDSRGGTDGALPAPAVQSVDRAVQILQLLTAEPVLGVSELSRRLGVHRSTAFRLLATLEAHDLVEQVAERGSYRLGFGLLRMAHSVIARTDLAREGQLVCDVLAAQLNETVNLAVLDGGYAVTITQSVGDRVIGAARQYVGQPAPLHATSTGKLLLAHAGEAEWDGLLERGLESFTDLTITDPEALAADLTSIRERGWAAAVAEWEDGTNALAVPVRDASGSVAAAVSLTAPEFRMPESEFAALAAQLRTGAASLEARLGYGRGQR
ncbi:IclR family transcriptional regulator [Brevibacterium daeguense]|uniref:IclR family transcriptional regulator n=1 Tax=Brevibacterium daeguense TaxID=909936 RepID=A0ABP8EJK9_9MICO|nr:IclR family transcriptional regulator [Brevibacterium daeguense]